MVKFCIYMIVAGCDPQILERIGTQKTLFIPTDKPLSLPASLLASLPVSLLPSLFLLLPPFLFTPSFGMNG